jgi:uncharacterized DUF497 family protein
MGPRQSNAESQKARGFISRCRFGFADRLAVTYHDPDHSLSEERFITVGMSRNGRVLIVAHSDRGENIRIISARNTTLRERKHYEEEN